MSKSAVVAIGVAMCVLGIAYAVVAWARSEPAGLIVVGLVLSALGALVIALSLRHRSRTKVKVETTSPTPDAATKRLGQTRVAVPMIIFVYLLIFFGAIYEGLESADSVFRWTFVVVFTFVGIVIFSLLASDPLKALKYTRANEIYLCFSLGVVLHATVEPILLGIVGGPISRADVAWFQRTLMLLVLVLIALSVIYARSYARSKGRSAAWGWIMLLNLIGIVVLARLADTTQPGGVRSPDRLPLPGA